MVRSSALVLLAFALAGDAAARGASTHTAGFAVHDGVAYFTTGVAMCRTDGRRAETLCFPVPGGNDGRTALLSGKAYAIFGGPQSLYEFDGANPPQPAVQLPRNEVASDLVSNGRHLFYFSMRAIPDGVRLMRSDGTAGGTSLVRAIPATEGRMLDRAGASILMRVDDTSTWRPRNDRALWTSDGTRDGTALLVPRTFLDFYARVGGAALFRSGEDLWRTDGTPGGTFVLLENAIPGAVSVREPFAYFALGNGVWRTDGTHAERFRTVAFQPHAVALAGSRLILLQHGGRQITVWSDEGPDGEPHPLVTIPSDGAPRAITHAGELVFFVVPLDRGRVQLWQTGGASQVSPVGTFASIAHVTAMGRNVLFLADDGVHGTEPWVSDGTPEGTMMLANLAPEGVVRGVVTDAATGLPIAGAIVEGGGATLVTGEGGRYELEGAIGPVKLQVRTDQHVAISRELTVNAHDELTADFALEPGARIEGRVTASSGAPRSRFAVQVIPDSGTPLALETDTDGRFRTPPIPTGPVWTVRADVQKGFNAAVQAGIRLTAGETRGVDLTMTPFGQIYFRMLDSITGGPVRTERFGLVRVFDVSGTAVAPYNPVDNSTAVVVLPDGEYHASTDSAVYLNRWLEGSGCGTQSCVLVRPAQRGTRIRVSGGTVTFADFVVTPRGGGVRGAIVDAESGAPVSGADISIQDPTGAYSWNGSVPGAVFESEPIFPDRTLSITVAPADPAYLPSAAVVDMRYSVDPHPEVRIELVRGGVLRGRVTDRNGQGIRDVRVSIAGRSARTDTIGSYAIVGIATGTYEVTATREGYAGARVENVALTNGKKTTLHLTMQAQ